MNYSNIKKQDDQRKIKFVLSFQKISKISKTLVTTLVQMITTMECMDEDEVAKTEGKNDRKIKRKK